MVAKYYILPRLFRVLVTSVVDVRDVIVRLTTVACDGRVEVLQLGSCDHNVTGAATKKLPELGRFIVHCCQNKSYIH